MDYTSKHTTVTYSTSGEQDTVSAPWTTPWTQKFQAPLHPLRTSFAPVPPPAFHIVPHGHAHGSIGMMNPYACMMRLRATFFPWCQKHPVDWVALALMASVKYRSLMEKYRSFMVNYR